MKILLPIDESASSDAAILEVEDRYQTSERCVCFTWCRSLFHLRLRCWMRVGVLKKRARRCLPGFRKRWRELRSD